jgi:glutamine amidotransferase
MIAIVDYGMGNVGSIANMLKRCGFEGRLVSTAEELERADKLILPGVGSFDTGMANLEQKGLRAPLEAKVASGAPLLGICLGMQLLFAGSEEGVRPGLGWLKGRCIRFRFQDQDPSLKIPHMGWNDVRPTERDTIFRDMAEDARYYFVHSYHAVCDDPSDVLGFTSHGYEFAAAVKHENVLGTQFHPEKSHSHGKRLLTAFAELK